MSLWVDKYRPKQLDKLHYHQHLSASLQSLASSPDFPHLLLYGPSGAGKKTRVVATLRALYGPGVEKLRIDQRVFVTPSSRKLEITIVQSNYHLELTPADCGNYDRVVVQDLLKEIAQTAQIDANAKQRFKVVVINEADLLTREAQAALRRTMEKYSTNLRLIMVANSTAKIIGPIRSRCLLMRVAAPSVQEIDKCLQFVASKEKFKLSDRLAERLATSSDRNLRRALLMLETVYATGGQPTDEVSIPLPDWETYTAGIANSMLKEQSPTMIMTVRNNMYELLTHCLPPSLILKTLLFDILERVDDVIKPEIVKAAAFYEHRLRLGSKPIFHLEGFVAKVMVLVYADLNDMDLSD
jgi:replication factor C subunit 3/5